MGKTISTTMKAELRQTFEVKRHGKKSLRKKKRVKESFGHSDRAGLLAGKKERGIAKLEGRVQVKGFKFALPRRRRVRNDKKTIVIERVDLTGSIRYIRPTWRLQKISDTLWGNKE